MNLQSSASSKNFIIYTELPTNKLQYKVVFFLIKKLYFFAFSDEVFHSDKFKQSSTSFTKTQTFRKSITQKIKKLEKQN